VNPYFVFIMLLLSTSSTSNEVQRSIKWYPMAKTKLEQPEFDITLNPRTKTVLIKKLEMQDPEFYDIILDQTESTRTDFVTKALKIGAIALKDVKLAEKVDYIKREFQKLCDELDRVFTRELGKEGMEGALETIFGDNGKLEQCLESMFGTDGKLARDLLDLNNKKSPIGQLRETMESYFVGKDSEVYEMLDSHVKDSPMCCLREDLMNELKSIETKITEQIAKKEIIQKTPQKGFIFEDTLDQFLLDVTAPFGDFVERVSKEKGTLGGKKGDFVIAINDPMTEGREVKIVVEAKTGEKITLTQKGLKGELDDAIKNRQANFAIAVTEASTEAAGCYRELEKDKIICAFGDNGLPLEVAYRVARARVLLNMHRESKKEIDTARICGMIDKIKNDLKTVQGIKTKLTSISHTSDDITNDIKQLETSIRESLDEIHEIIRLGETP
jgi:hypothetical protein